MMQCNDVTVLLSAYMDSELAPDEEALVKAHISACLSCQTLLSELETTRGITKETYATVYAPGDMIATVMSQLVTTKQNAQFGRVATAFGMTMGIVCFLGLVLVLSPVGILIWPILHMMLSFIRGVYGLRNSIGVVWTLSGLFVAVGFSFLWLRLMGRLLRQSRSEATI